MTSGCVTGLLTRMGVDISATRINERTGVPFFSEPYEENCETFKPWRSASDSARSCPARLAPNPPMDSKRNSREASVMRRLNPFSSGQSIHYIEAGGPEVIYVTMFRIFLRKRL